MPCALFGGDGEPANKAWPQRRFADASFFASITGALIDLIRGPTLPGVTDTGVGHANRGAIPDFILLSRIVGRRLPVTN
jgi:hypothetical protein